MATGLLTGAAFGLIAVYLLNFHVIVPIIFPWFTMAQDWVSVLSHLVFGVVLAAVYITARDRRAER